MKEPIMVGLVAGAVLAGGCAMSQPGYSNPSSPIAAPQTGTTVNYDDRQIQNIRRGETTEAQLLEWFGPPETRQVSGDGRAALSWGWGKAGGSAGGALNVQLSPEGRVSSYSARQRPAAEKQTVEFVQRSETDIRKQMERWRREGWNVLSLSGPIPQTDGTVKRKAELSKAEGVAGQRMAYDDRLIAAIQRGKTSADELCERFGPAYSRDLQPDGRMQLAWKFGDVNAARGNSGELNASVAPNGKVDSYAARRGP